MKILVGSTNPVKLIAVEEAFSLYFENLKVIGKLVNSGVPDQPINDETYIGAKNRANELIKLDIIEKNNSDFFVGIEGGIQNIFNKWFAFGCMYIVDRNGNSSFGTSANFELPKEILKQLHARKELGYVMDKIMKQTNTKQNGGAISFFTNGKMNRKELYIPGLISALVPFQHKQMYFNKD